MGDACTDISLSDYRWQGVAGYSTGQCLQEYYSTYAGSYRNQTSTAPPGAGSYRNQTTGEPFS
jgi:hypothetical protein